MLELGDEKGENSVRRWALVRRKELGGMLFRDTCSKEQAGVIGSVTCSREISFCLQMWERGRG